MTSAPIRRGDSVVLALAPVVPSKYIRIVIGARLPPMNRRAETSRTATGGSHPRSRGLDRGSRLIRSVRDLVQRTIVAAANGVTMRFAYSLTRRGTKLRAVGMSGRVPKTRAGPTSQVAPA